MPSNPMWFCPGCGDYYPAGQECPQCKRYARITYYHRKWRRLAENYGYRDPATQEAHGELRLAKMEDA